MVWSLQHLAVQLGLLLTGLMLVMWTLDDEVWLKVRGRTTSPNPNPNPNPSPDPSPNPSPNPSPSPSPIPSPNPNPNPNSNPNPNPDQVKADQAIEVTSQQEAAVTTYCVLVILWLINWVAAIACASHD
jgi:hypothetical protein